MAGSSCNDIVSGDNLDCLMSGHFDRKIRVWDARFVQPNKACVVYFPCF